MTTNFDIALDGDGYMVIPGSYRASTPRASSATSETRRVRMAGFSAGFPGGGSDGAWPASWPVGTAGVGPGPARSSAGSTAVDPPRLSVTSRDYLYLIAGSVLYRWSGSGAPVARATPGTGAVDMARKGGDLFVAFDTTRDVVRWKDENGTLTNSVLGPGYQARRVGAIGDLLVTSEAGEPSTIDIWNADLSSSTSVKLAGDVQRMTSYGDGLIVATDRELYIVRGVSYGDFAVESWGGISPGPQGNDDYAWLTVFQGRLAAWSGQQVMLYDRTRETWQPAGLQGESSSGAAVASGWLFVAATPRGGGDEELWGYDGAGWWRLHSPDSNPAASPDGKLVTFVTGSATLFYYEPGDLHTAAKLISPFQVMTGLLDDGQPDVSKEWTAIGIELARPDGYATGSWDFSLEYSTDAGANWSAAGTSEVNSPLDSIDAAISATANALRIRITASRNAGLPPFITAIWAEYATSPASSTPRRRWEFQVHATDNAVDRNGAADPRTGQAIRSALWNLYTAGATVAFRDVDYAATTVEHNVRLIEVRESWRQPADQPELGADTLLIVTLEELD